MKTQEDSPTPQPDQPLSEKNVSSNSNKNILNNNWLKFGILGLVLLLLLGGAYFLGKSNTTNQTSTNPTRFASTPTTPVTVPSTITPTKPQKAFLEIPEYGVKFALTENIKDAYYLPVTADKGYIYLKVHALDSEPQCLKDPSSTAAIARLGKNDPVPFGQTYEEFTTNRATGVTVGKYFYYIDLAQYPCAESPSGQKILEKVRKEFSEASKTITAL